MDYVANRSMAMSVVKSRGICERISQCLESGHPDAMLSNAYTADWIKNENFISYNSSVHVVSKRIVFSIVRQTCYRNTAASSSV